MTKAKICLVAALALAACADLSITESWKGRHMRELTASWGPPTKIYDVANGGKHLVYRMAEDRWHVWMGDTKKPALVRRCFATFTTDRRGIIVTAGQEGTPGGCSMLVKGVKPRAPSR